MSGQSICSQAPLAVETLRLDCIFHLLGAHGLRLEWDRGTKCILVEVTPANVDCDVNRIEWTPRQTAHNVLDAITYYLRINKTADGVHRRFVDDERSVTHMKCSVFYKDDESVAEAMRMMERLLRKKFVLLTGREDEVHCAQSPEVE